MSTVTTAGPDTDGTSAPREADLGGRPGSPLRLGRDPAAPDGAPLAGQLQALRQRLPDRRPVRIAIIGGFGASLGDTVVGATAWRAAASIASATLPAFTVDVVLGSTAHPAIADLLAGEPGIEQVRFKSMTLEAFSRDYDAYLDCTRLLSRPRFHEGAQVDWMLWWLGLDPARVPAHAKRNRLELPAASLAWADSRLAPLPRPRIGFVWCASTPLRTMPDAIAVAFARDLLATASAITLVTDRSLPLDHPRLVQIEATSALDMMALVASVDGLVSVDSLALHVADAAGVPTIAIVSSLPRSRFPYYPAMSVVTPPGADALPGWGLTKVPDEAWATMASDYSRVWSNVSAAECWPWLAARLRERASADRNVAARSAG